MSIITSKEEKAIAEKIKLEEARSQLQYALDDQADLYKQLSQDIIDYEEKIMEAFDRGDEIEATMLCTNLQNAEDQRLICGSIRIALNQALVDLKSCMAIKQANQALKNIKNYATITPEMVKSFSASHSNSKVIMDIFKANIQNQSNRRDVQDTFTKMKERYKQSRMSNAPVSHDINNDTNHKTNT